MKQTMKKIKRSYLIVFNYYGNNRDAILSVLNREGLQTWRTEISGCIMLKTVNSAKIVRDLLADTVEGRFLVAEISGNRSGTMTQKGWDFLGDSRDTEVVYD
jgi:hypothetical protein